MLDKLFRCLGLGSQQAPSIPGMQVVDWRIDELKSGSTMIALCHKDTMLHVVSYKQSCPDEKYVETVDLANIYPSFKAQFALYCKKSPVKENISIKRTQILDLISANDACAAHGIAHEAYICDRLGVGHPNIIQFLGVRVSDELVFTQEGVQVQVPLAEKSVTGLVFKKYDCTLDELVIRGHKVDIRQCLNSVAAAIQYLHQKTLVHGDLSPHNIFVRRGIDSDHFALGELGSAQNTGEMITFQTGANRWSKRKRAGVDRAEEEDDWYAFRKLTEWLLKETGEKSKDYKGLEVLAQH